jgi:hypothetical protein
MASKKLTFTLPEELAAEFLSKVPTRLRSQYVAAAILAKLQERNDQLIRSCRIANKSADVLEIESSFDAQADESDRIREQW